MQWQEGRGFPQMEGALVSVVGRPFRLLTFHPSTAGISPTGTHV